MTIKIHLKIECPNCNGKGVIPFDKKGGTNKCCCCDGTGEVERWVPVTKNSAFEEVKNLFSALLLITP